jgi:uncharacterized iron-regulated membrane protein
MTTTPPSSRPIAAYAGAALGALLILTGAGIGVYFGAIKPKQDSNNAGNPPSDGDGIQDGVAIVGAVVGALGVAISGASTWVACRASKAQQPLQQQDPDEVRHVAAQARHVELLNMKLERELAERREPAELKE